MNSVDPDRTTEPPQRPRFGPIREIPPDDVLKAAPDRADWIVERFGDDSGFPNGGIWRVTSSSSGHRPFTTWVKRTGAGYLGDSPVWRCRFAPDDPQWWGREAEFYGSDLATSGWSPEVRAAHCYAIDDHDECRDLWLESVDTPASLPIYAKAAAGLAGWQVAHIDSRHRWLSTDWIPHHIRRHELDNDRTLSHPGWPSAISRGLDPALREIVKARITDPMEIQRSLREFPQVLTHYDFHHCNIGTVGDEVVIIDWAFVGWGPIGHDVGHLALDLTVTVEPPDETWHTMQTAYCDGLKSAGWTGDLELVKRSMAVSNHLRLSWNIDHVLNMADQISDETLAAFSARVRFLAGRRLDSGNRVWG